MKEGKEKWKRIQDTRYFISNKGRVKSTETFGRDTRGRIKHKDGKILSTNGLINGYPAVNIIYDGKRKAKKVHQLVAEYFIDNKNGFNLINHKDGNKKNNIFTNLEWCTASHNLKHAYKNGLSKPVRNFGKNNGFSKMVIDISTGIVFESVKEAAYSFNIKSRTLNAMLSGQNRNRTNLIYL